MNTIQIFSDGTKSNTNTFSVDAAIWGTVENCNAYSSEIEKIIFGNKKLGKDFKGLHAYNLNDKNWTTLGRVYEDVFAVLSDYIRKEKLKSHIVIVSQTRYDSNAGYLKSIFKKELANRESVIGKLFLSLEETDMPALYHRIDSLFPYWQHRAKYGDEHDIFEFYPDSEGKILKYDKAKFAMSGNYPFSVDLKFSSLIVALANAFSELLKLYKGWSQTTHRLSDFAAQKWTSSSLIQSCDALSNFVYNSIRFASGMEEDKYRLKSELLNKYFGTDAVMEGLKSSFKVQDEDVACIDQTFWGTIDLE